MMETEEDDCGFFQLAKSAFLSRVVKGEIDLNAWVKLELANRGLDKNGKWIGFDKSKKLFGIKD